MPPRFGELERLPNVKAHVLAGGVPECPRNCPPVVYEQLMMPCWRAKPSDRVGFTELYLRALDLGGIWVDRDRPPSISKSDPMFSTTAGWSA